ncbi:MAG: response regulator, partial [Spirochaetales bacterium]|nr:response regulator [Spirochaetales bacterium]
QKNSLNRPLQFRLRFEDMENYIWVEGRLIGVQNDLNGFPLIFEGIFRNITAEKERDLQWERERREREVADRKNRFFSTVSHELLTPMNGIIGITEQLSRGELNREEKELVNKMNNSSLLLLDRIHDLLDISELTQGDTSFQKELFSPAELLSEIWDSQKNAAQAAGIELILKGKDNLPEYLKGDRKRIGQIVLNLVKNGLKFTPRGKVLLEGEIKEKAGRFCRLKVSVKDEGIGIPEEKLSSIFEPFGQVDNSRQRIRGGIGLSLAINKRLVEMMDGIMGVRSSPGEGSVFFIELPLEMGKSEETAPGPGHFIYPEARILVVDDNPINREIAADLLALRKAEVITAAGGQEALDAMAEVLPHLVFMDIEMPGMDGYTAVRLQRERERGESPIPIIAFTANFTEENKKSAYQAGMNGYLTKPADIKKIDGVLEKWLAPFRLSEEDSPAEEKTHPPIPGIAMEETMERFADEYDMLIELLHNYLEDYRDFGNEIRDLMDREDYKGVHRRVHSLKGVSGSLGISDVYNQSKKLCDNYARSDRFEATETEDLAELMIRFAKNLNAFLAD